ncbi:MAG TPA: NapC/NirT family cytochrome c [Thermoanaerobaculia bacterium]|nr:NapC/NirT family cytochrome c [Thermoanaerobaculia bacterium]
MARGARERVSTVFRLAVFLGQNKISLAGAILTTSSAVTLLVFWIYLIVQGRPIHPYASIVFFLILPAFFALGLVLMPLGGYLRRRKLRARGELPREYPKVDLRSTFLRRAALLVAGLTFLNFAIMGAASYKGVEYMDSAQFCGQTCHTVMSPEYTAYLNSPHSRVACVECHIGPGAPWFVKAKIDGVRQVFAVAMKTYSRPIPSPVRTLRPARDTCEHCHWPQKFTGDKLLVRTKYADDEQNTPATSVLLLKIGGRTAQGRVGIHGRHLDTVERIEYVSTDGNRQVIPLVNYIDDNGKQIQFLSTDVKATAPELAGGERRKMDCMDCHNRPTHAFQMPDRAVDEAMAAGRISTSLPYIKREAVAALRATYADREAAGERIPAAVGEFYRTKYPSVYQKDRAAVETAAEQVKAIYLRNIFPEMKVTWGSHPNNIGHDDFLGCFRCHDGKHKSSDGRVIQDDCETCHQVLAMEEKEPKILADLGLK